MAIHSLVKFIEDNVEHHSIDNVKNLICDVYVLPNSVDIRGNSIIASWNISKYPMESMYVHINTERQEIQVDVYQGGLMTSTIQTFLNAGGISDTHTMLSKMYGRSV